MTRMDSQLLAGLEVMFAIVESRSFSAAAEVVGLSQPGVSRAVARLEARLGMRVFERTTRAVRLTDEGRRYYEAVRPLVAAIAEATESAAGTTAVIRGRLRVNVDPLFAQAVLAPQIGRFMDRHPALEVELRSRDDLGDMVAEGFDLALRFGHPRASSLVARRVFDTRVIAAASPAYLKRFGRPADPGALETAAHRCILFREAATGGTFAWEFRQGRRKRVVVPQGRLTVNEAGAVYAACLAGQGIAQLFELGIEQHLASGALLPVFPEWCDLRFPLYAYYPTRHHVPAKTRALLAFVAELAAGQAGVANT
ncbi:LysR family transcriptional regulator [Stenotrophomonas sp. 24(2023)]|uniref:LysR family transcriptional regulator n=1 Tax=Stenotrophomonas sp. 24(2023) TaxID=3068324 RepID=UPI0027DFA703|nr:LysR family transcriptional regulator [Stenotrophomonas sp. 24(2023)]WMJ69277.1 LysR family transcriptional regulator [Stenotrophomonas sp. 24(2023)]